MRIQDLSDRQLVEAYRNGQESAFGELLKRHKSRVFGKIMMYVKDRTIAEDIFQEVWRKTSGQSLVEKNRIGVSCLLRVPGTPVRVHTNNSTTNNKTKTEKQQQRRRQEQQEQQQLLQQQEPSLILQLLH